MLNREYAIRSFNHLEKSEKMGINLHININVRITLLRFMVNG